MFSDESLRRSGLVVRSVDEVTGEHASTPSAVCSIVSEEIGNAGCWCGRSQSFARLPALPALGVMRDGRTLVVAFGNRVAPDSMSKLPGTFEWE